MRRSPSLRCCAPMVLPEKPLAHQLLRPSGRTATAIPGTCARTIPCRPRERRAVAGPPSRGRQTWTSVWPKRPTGGYLDSVPQRHAHACTHTSEHDPRALCSRAKRKGPPPSRRRPAPATPAPSPSRSWAMQMNATSTGRAGRSCPQQPCGHAAGREARGRPCAVGLAPAAPRWRGAGSLAGRGFAPSSGRFFFNT